MRKGILGAFEVSLAPVSRLRGSLAFAAALVVGCNAGERAAGVVDASIDGPPPWATEASPEPEPRPGMVWIPPGVLIAGTPIDRLPRVADEEMAGEQVVMHGFHVDVFPHPNEAGAIPTTNLTQAEANEVCVSQGKRLCTELELERACKGPANLTYEYGDAYKASACGTGSGRSLVPNGVNAACQSELGVHDLHGGVWSWTASQWRRDPAKSGLFALRGGNGAPGELFGRCANGRGLRADVRREDVGVRCCAGEPNTFEVVLSVTRGEPLRWQPPDDRIAPALEKLVPGDVIEAGKGGRPEDQFHMERLWTWHPLGNEELVVGGGCARAGQKERARCGVVVARLRFETAASLAWVPSEYWQPAIAEAETPREIFLMGGDRNGAFRRRVSYAWGRIAVADKERKKKRKGFKDPTY
jgi:formylglycine-generating enzyme required for sulfatase activity